MTNSKQEDTGSLWENARGYANLLGQLPSSFSSTMRTLKGDADKGLPAGKSALFLANRLASSPSMKVSLYFALKTYQPELLEGKSVITSKDLVKLFKPEDLLAFMGVSYLYRKAKKLAQEEEWALYTKGIHARADLGIFLGYSIDKVGAAKGFFTACMDTIALTAFHLHDKKGFTDYRRSLKSKNVVIDAAYELQRWGCTRYHVASILIQSLCLGVPFANSYAVGLLAEDSAENSLSPDAYAFKVTKVWIDSLEKTGKTPDRAMRTDFYPETAAFKRLTDQVARVRSEGSLYSWLEKSKDNLSPEATPHLMGDTKSSSKIDDQIPDELKGQISEKDLDLPDDE